MRLALQLFFGGIIASALVSSGAEAWTVTPRSTMAINTTAVPAMMELSGAAYRGPLGGSLYDLYAVQDSGNQLVSISFGLATNGSLTSAAATATLALSPGFDFEGVALGPAGSVMVSTEEALPAIRRYDTASGAVTATLSMPAVFANSRSNLAFESLTRAWDGVTYWTANEQALTVDGPTATTTAGTTVRLQQFSYDTSGTLTLGHEYAYTVAPIHAGTVSGSAQSGLVDLVALPDGSLLTLERSLANTTPLYENRIYRVTFTGATDISQATFDAGLVGPSYTAVSKTLLWQGQVGGGLFGQNMEGLALGPQLPGGDWALLGVVDDGDPFSSNTLVSFSLSPSVPGDFNGSGTVDAADYVVWRSGPGTLFTSDDYNVWRSHFGQSAGSGAAVGSNSPNGSVVPEPTTLAILLFGAASLFYQRAIKVSPRMTSNV